MRRTDWLLCLAKNCDWFKFKIQKIQLYNGPKEPHNTMAKVNTCMHYSIQSSDNSLPTEKQTKQVLLKKQCIFQAKAPKYEGHFVKLETELKCHGNRRVVFHAFTAPSPTCLATEMNVAS